MRENLNQSAFQTPPVSHECELTSLLQHHFNYILEERNEHNLEEEWCAMRTPFLQVLLKGEYPACGLTCSRCDEPGEYRCLECFPGNLLCSVCIIQCHEHVPLHRIEQWANSSFEKTSLFHLQLPVYISHHSHHGAQCPHSTTPADVVVVHTNRIHHINTHFCPLEVLDKAMVLFEAKLFPASLRNLRMVFTFDMLQTYQMMNFESCTSMWDYFDLLVRLTDNVVLSAVLVSSCFPNHLEFANKIIAELLSPVLRGILSMADLANAKAFWPY
jgi:hypothetical protein